LIAFSLADKRTFEGIKTWIESIYKHCDLNIPKVLVGNKCDLVDLREVPESEARKIAEEY
jgi:GTPase SAR1 family protein